jgi:hypothetical protein
MTVTSVRLPLAAMAGVTLTVLFDTPLQQPGFAQSNDSCAATLSLSASTGGPAARAQADGREPKDVHSTTMIAGVTSMDSINIVRRSRVGE